MRHKIGFLTGLFLFFFTVLFAEFPDLSQSAQYTMAIGILMATWWATEALPIPITALLPIVLFPLMEISSLKEATGPFGHPLIFLFLGGFMLAIAMEKWNLHKRLALSILVRTTDSPGKIIGGFMFVSAILSMWVTNTATTMMLVPIAISVIHLCTHESDLSKSTIHKFSTSLLLAIAYASSIGGLGTLIGTVPNTILAGFMRDQANLEVSFIQWMKIGVPIVVVMVPIVWIVIVKFVFPTRDFKTQKSKKELSSLKASLGAFSHEEKKVAVVFVCTALLWTFRPLINQWLSPIQLSDTGIAIASGITLFTLNSADKKSRILVWEDSKKLPWSLLLMFGGGLSLAAAVKTTGLSTWLGEGIGAHITAHPIIVVLCIVAFTVFITELTSNTATTATFLPIMAAVADGMGMNPFLLLFPTTIAASCAFMLPVATPPNGIVYGSGLVSVPDMMRAGFWLNIISIFIVTLFGYFLVKWFF